MAPTGREEARDHSGQGENRYIYSFLSAWAYASRGLTCESPDDCHHNIAQLSRRKGLGNLSNSFNIPFRNYFFLVRHWGVLMSGLRNPKLPHDEVESRFPLKFEVLMLILHFLLMSCSFFLPSIQFMCTLSSRPNSSLSNYSPRSACPVV